MIPRQPPRMGGDEPSTEQTLHDAGSKIAAFRATQETDCGDRNDTRYRSLGWGFGVAPFGNPQGYTRRGQSNGSRCGGEPTAHLFDRCSVPHPKTRSRRAKWSSLNVRVSLIPSSKIPAHRTKRLGKAP